MKFGDDLSLLETFELDGVTSFAGFSSLNAVADHVSKTRHKLQGYAAEGLKQDTRFQDFSGTKNIDEALNLAKFGWHDGAKEAEKWIDTLTVDAPAPPRNIHGIAGGAVNVPRMLSGDPLHMISRGKAPKSKIITLVSNVSTPSRVPAKTMRLRAYITCALIDVLETSGYRCNLVAVSCAAAQGLKTMHVVKLKDSSDPLNLSDVAFGCGHPSMTRRILFCVSGSNPELRRFCNAAFGAPQEITIKDRDTFMVPGLINFKGSDPDKLKTYIISDLQEQGCPIQDF